jgi:CheY-like chemotaxis protein
MKRTDHRPEARTVLIVDDDNRNIFALKAVLRSYGYEAISAVSAAEGLRMLAEQSDIGIVLMDMMMPEMDGYEALKTIRESPRREIPVVSVTAQAMTGDKEKSLAAGADEYLSKPIDVDKLLAILNRYLS